MVSAGGASQDKAGSGDAGTADAVTHALVEPSGTRRVAPEADLEAVMTTRLVLATIAALAAFAARAEIVETQESTTVETREHPAPSAQPKNVIETDEDADE